MLSKVPSSFLLCGLAVELFSALHATGRCGGKSLWGSGPQGTPQKTFTAIRTEKQMAKYSATVHSCQHTTA